MAHKNNPPPTYSCSFCRKTHKQVQRLIAGPHFVYICNECIVGLHNKSTDPQLQQTAQQTKLLCSFCGNKPTPTRFLHEGPANVHICNECILLCVEILEEEQRLAGQ